MDTPLDSGNGGGDGKKKIPPFLYQPPDYTQFAKDTGFGYNNLFDQMKDAFSIPSRGAGVFMGNTAPRYGGPAPNMTFPTAFQGLLAQFMGPQGGMAMGRPLPPQPGGMQGPTQGGGRGLLGGR